MYLLGLGFFVDVMMMMCVCVCIYKHVKYLYEEAREYCFIFQVYIPI